MKVIKNLNQVVLALLVIPVMMGCSKETDEDKVGDAQFCLDDIPITGLPVPERSSKINTCLDKMSSVNTKQANLIRCASGFMIEGFADPQRLLSIAAEMDDSSNQDPTTALMGVLIFKSQGGDEGVANDDDKALAKKTFDYCNAAESSGYLMLASVANMATVIAASIGGINLSAGIDNLINNPDAVAAEVIGATATAAYQTSCVNSNDSNSEICTQLGAAITSNGGDMTAIGTSLLATWQASPP